MTDLDSTKLPSTREGTGRRYSQNGITKNGENGSNEGNNGIAANKRSRETEPSIRNGRVESTNQKKDFNSFTKGLEPARSPNSKAKQIQEEVGIDVEVPQEEIEFEESLRFFEYSRETVKAFWFLPLRRILAAETKEIRLESLAFPANNSKKWRFMAEIDKDKDKSKLTKAYFGVSAILNEEEEKNLEWKREPYVFIRITTKRGPFDVEKGFNRAFSNKNKDSGISQQEKALSDIDITANDYLIVECLIRETRVPKNTNAEYVGLINAGNTCYMNSFLQTLYHLPAFTRAVYRIPFNVDRPDLIPTALQKLFYNLKYARKPVPTTELIRSFGWDKKQAWIQQDVQEFCCLLLAALENKTKGITEVEGAINDLFEGKVSSVISCINVEFSSVREEKFLEIQLMVKGMGNIYQSLDYFVQSEELTGDNRYDAENFGKQDAYKRIIFERLPPILLIHLKRFEYDYGTDANVKINDSCEYYDRIDLGKYLSPERTQETKYLLFSVLVHSGTGSSSGHYYVFLRPGGRDGRWFKLNDELVSMADPEDVFEANFGGTHTEAKLNDKKEIETTEATNESNAYMLVYVRMDQLPTLLRPIKEEDVPRKLIEEIEKNKKFEEERRKKGEDFFKVYITSFELLKDLETPGLAFYKTGSRDDENVTRFLKKKTKRIKIYLRKNFKVYDLLKFVSNQTGIPQDQIMMWKIGLAKEQIAQVLKRNYLTSPSPNVLVLANGVNSNQTKSIFIIHTLDRAKYPVIFKENESHLSTYFEISCKNVLDFVCYNEQIQIEQKLERLDFEPKESNEKEATKIDEIPKDANQLFLDLIDEKYIIVFLKIYTYRDDTPKIELRDYYLMNKTLRVHDLLDNIQNREENFDKEDIIIYKEDKKKYLLEPLKLNDPLDDSAESGLVCVIEFKGADFNEYDQSGIQCNFYRENYITAQEHYQTLSNRVWVNFIAHESRDPYRILLDGNMNYVSIIEFVSKNLFQGEIEPDRILLKAKWKNAMSFVAVPYTEDNSIKLADLVKHDEKVHFEVSKIEVNLLHKKLKCFVHYYSVMTNNTTNDEEIFVEKNSTVEKLLEEIQNFGIFAEEMKFDRDSLNKESQLKLLLIDKKRNKLIGQGQNELGLAQYNQKYRLRVELVPKECEEDTKKDASERYYPIYCVHATRDGEYFSNPFLFFSKRIVTGNEFRENLYEHIKDWDIFYEKKITMNKEYFSKLKLNLKGDSNEGKYSKIENEDHFPLQELDDEARKYTLELIYPFSIPNTHGQMKINT